MELVIIKNIQSLIKEEGLHNTLNLVDKQLTTVEYQKYP